MHNAQFKSKFSLLSEDLKKEVLAYMDKLLKSSNDKSNLIKGYGDLKGKIKIGKSFNEPISIV
jgi:hypothetical protein